MIFVIIPFPVILFIADGHARIKWGRHLRWSDLKPWYWFGSGPP